MEVRDGAFEPLLHTLGAAVLGPEQGLAVVRDPVAVREDPATAWRWLVPLREAGSREGFEELHRRMSFEVLRNLVAAPERELAPLKSVPAWYVDLP